MAIPGLPKYLSGVPDVMCASSGVTTEVPAFIGCWPFQGDYRQITWTAWCSNQPGDWCYGNTCSAHGLARVLSSLRRLGLINYLKSFCLTHHWWLV